MVGCAQGNVAIATDEAQQVPDLLLAAIAAAPFALDPVRGHFVAQPLAGAAENLDVPRQQADFFFKLPKHRQLGRLTGMDAALRKLPRVFADPLAPEDKVLRVDDDDGDVRAIAVTVQHHTTCDSASWLHFSTDRGACKAGRAAARRPAAVDAPRIRIPIQQLRLLPPWRKGQAAEGLRQAGGADSRGVTDSASRRSRRSTITSNASSMRPPVNNRCKSSTPMTGAWPRATMMS